MGKQALGGGAVSRPRHCSPHSSPLHGILITFYFFKKTSILILILSKKVTPIPAFKKQN